jgi:polyhydroxybutyrate depolymerase
MARGGGQAECGYQRANAPAVQGRELPLSQERVPFTGWFGGALRQPGSRQQPRPRREHLTTPVKGPRSRIGGELWRSVSTGVAILCAFFLCAWTAAHARASLEWVNVDGSLRSFEVHLPIGYDSAQKYPVVILLHGSEETAEDMARLSRFDFVADRYGFIAFYPNSDEADWDVGVAAAPAKRPTGRRGGDLGLPVPFPLPGGQGAQKRGTRTESQLGDVPFFEYMLDKLASTYSVDRNRIFATGYSDGGIMIFRLGCSMSDRIAAVAPVAGALPKEMSLHCELSRGVPLLMINGTSDPVVPYGGGHLRGTGLTTLPVKTAAARWAELDRCALKPTQTALPPPNKKGMKTILNTYGNCRDGAEVSLYTIEGGGNTWPSGTDIVPEKQVGKTSTDLDADEVIWRFFSAHPMRASSSAGH